MAAVDRPRGWRKVGRYLVLSVVAFVVLFPVYAVVVGAFKQSSAVLDHPRSLVPTGLTVDLFREAWTEGRLSRYLLTSTIVSTVITVGAVTTSVLSAYAFAYLRFPLKGVLFVVMLSTLLVPAEVTALVNNETMASLGWRNTYQALFIPFLATAFGTFLVRQVFLTVPKDLREAALLDGLGHWGFLWDVAVPLARPTLGALALFSFLGSWNMYLWPRIVNDNADRRTVQTGLQALSGQLDRPNLVMAGLVIAALPIFAVLVVFQKQLIRGLTAGAVKG
jgi:sn-glycerol 3-phosphate transport system permease protein